MKSSCIKAAVAAAALTLLGAGPAASAETAKPAAKHHKAQARTKAKAPQAAKAKPAELPAVAAAVPAAAQAVAQAVAQVAAPAATPVAVPVVAAMPAAPAPGYEPSRPASNPYLAHQGPVTPVNPWQNAGVVASNVKSFLPSLPEGQALLPRIKRVYPTGEKPLVVVTFKCPTELVGVTPMPTKFLHELVNLGMDGINATNLLAFNLQQVCQ